MTSQIKYVNLTYSIEVVVILSFMWNIHRQENMIDRFLLFTIVSCCGVLCQFPEDDYHPSRIQYGSQKAPPASSQIDWMSRAKDELKTTLNAERKLHAAKNVVVFIGDGMGISTLTAGRVYKAQSKGRRIEDSELEWETFPATGLIKTYNVDRQTPDSAGTATAFTCGEKTKFGMIGVNQKAIRGDCDSIKGNELRSFIHYAIDEKKRTGIISTATISHATPAASYAHTSERNWEDDSSMPKNTTCWDIARQLVHSSENKHIRVILGGGRRSMLPNTTLDPEYGTNGRRLDNRNLIQDWKDIHRNMLLTESQYKYVENTEQFNAINTDEVDYLMGLFEPGYMKYEADRRQETGLWTEPSLAEMVAKALEILKKGPDGFVLYVEGGRIDHGHHEASAHLSLNDVLSLDEAVNVAKQNTNENDTLIVLTADHSHTFTMGGYSDLNNDILGVTTEDGQVKLADDNLPFTTLGYANGPGFYYHRSEDGSLENQTSRINITGVNTLVRNYRQDAPVPLNYETHGGEDVGVYASGPMSHLFVGQHEQHYIAHATMYASCLGWNKDLCENPPPCQEPEEKVCDIAGEKECEIAKEEVCEIAGGKIIHGSVGGILVMVVVVWMLTQ